MNSVKAWAVLSCIGVLLAACSSTPPAAPSGMAKPAGAAAPMAAAPAKPAMPTPMASSTVATVSLPEYLDPKSAISTNRSVYFDFDDATLKADSSTLIERQGNYLRSHAMLAVKIEGNCDERGSSKYNLALGQKRAEAVLHALNALGVKDSQMEAISWGKEKPRALGHDEAAWAQNRRADIVYPNH